MREVQQASAADADAIADALMDEFEGDEDAYDDEDEDDEEELDDEELSLLEGRSS